MSATFSWDLSTDELAWSDSMYELYGYAAGSIRPSMHLLFEHKHPADRPRLRHLLQATRRERTPYVFRHRIVTADDVVRDIVVAARATAAGAGDPVRLTGTAVDLSAVIVGPSFGADEREAGELREQVRHLELALRNRDLIGQAKGVLMRTYGIPADEAFELLRLASQRTNRKLTDLADEVARTGQLVVD